MEQVQFPLAISAGYAQFGVSRPPIRLAPLLVSDLVEFVYTEGRLG
jgi:hypothetical protein